MRVARDEETGEEGLNMTPLIDMMFILVIFFLATSRFQQDERDEAIRLAKSRSGLPISAASDVLVINIDQQGRRIVDGRIRSLEELEALVRERRAEKATTEVVLRCDVRGAIAPFAEALEVCHRLGIKAPSFTYSAGDGSP